VATVLSLILIILNIFSYERVGSKEAYKMGKISFFINRIANYFSVILLVLLTFLTVADVFGRYFLNKPIPGTLEITELVLSLIVFLAFGYAEHFNEHIVIDTLYELLPQVIKRFVYLFSMLLSFTVITLMGWQLYIFGERMQNGGYSTAILRIPLYPIVLLTSVGSICYALAMISNVATTIKKWRREKV
jgi:TRAP-type C4-dicarboxylate transport system permease small subunit